MNNFINAKYDDVGGVRDHILSVIHKTTRFKEYEMPVADNFLYPSYRQLITYESVAAQYFL